MWEFFEKGEGRKEKEKEKGKGKGRRGQANQYSICKFCL